MKLQKITQKRWFWPLVCAVSVVFGWWYLSIVTCAPLGGDDELINLQNYYYITHTSFGQSVLDYLGDLWEQFSLQNGRFRPFSSPPVRGLTSWFLGDLVGYRLYILAWTYADIVLTAWLVGKASRNKKLGIACLCLLPMMFSVWQDSTGNSLYSYGALVQSTLLPALVAGLAVLRWQDTGHKRWAVLAGYCMFQCCATFEIGFTYIVPIFGLAWLYTDKARDALRLSIPALLGECVTLAFNMGARLMNTLRAAGILAGSVSQIEGISPNFDLPAILRTWAMQMSAGFPLNAMLFGKMRPGKIYPVDVLCGVMVAGAAVAALAALDKLPNKKQNLLLFLSGLAMLSAPALLIGLSPKYQQPGQVDWRHGYIPQTVESFGVGLMALAVLVMLLRRARGKSWRPGGRAVLYSLLAVCMAGSVVWQRAATRSAYDQGGRAYTVFGDGVAAGLAADCGGDSAEHGGAGELADVGSLVLHEKMPPVKICESQLTNPGGSALPLRKRNALPQNIRQGAKKAKQAAFRFFHPDFNRRPRNHTGSAAAFAAGRGLAGHAAHRRWGITPRPETDFPGSIIA